MHCVRLVVIKIIWTIQYDLSGDLLVIDTTSLVFSNKSQSIYLDIRHLKPRRLVL